MFNLVVSMEPLDARLSFQSWFSVTRKDHAASRIRTWAGRSLWISISTTRPSQLVHLSWVRYVQPRRFIVNHLTDGFLSKAGSLSLTQKWSRCEQDSNLRGMIPLDFESNALTAWPSQLVQISWVRYVQPRRFNVNHSKPCFLSTVGFFTQKGLAASRNRTCAWRSHWISSPTPLPLGHHIWCN